MGNIIDDTVHSIGSGIWRGFRSAVMKFGIIKTLMGITILILLIALLVRSQQ